MATNVETRTLRRITWRIIPFVMLLYFMVFFDRVNTGFASLTMNKDLGLSPAAFGFGAGIFFWGYFLCEIPSNIALHKFGARLWIARIMISWGVLAAFESQVQGPTGFYIIRFLLGAAEAGFFPGVILYLSYWFPTRQRATAVSLFMAAAPLSTALGSPISSAILGLNGLLDVAGWQWLFLIESVPAVALGLVTLVYMTDRPEQAKWLADDERAWLVATLDAERAGKSAQASQSVWRALSDPRVLGLALVYFGTSSGLYTLGIWAPQIIKSFGLSTMQVGFLNALPPTAAVIGMYVWSWHSDRTGERPWHVIIACLVASLGLILAGQSTAALGAVAALVVVNVGITSAKPPLWAMPTSFLVGSAAAAGLAAINSVGNLGGFVAPAMIGWIKAETGGFAGGLFFVAGLLVISAIVTFLVSRTVTKSAADLKDTASVPNTNA